MIIASGIVNTMDSRSESIPSNHTLLYRKNRGGENRAGREKENFLPDAICLQIDTT